MAEEETSSTRQTGSNEAKGEETKSEVASDAKEVKEEEASEAKVSAEDKSVSDEEDKKEEEKTPSNGAGGGSEAASDAELSPEMEELAKKYNKLISEIEKLSIVELAELVQVLEKKFGVSAAAPVAASDAGEGDEKEKDSFDVMLQASGDLKINVIKIVREITGLGLKESKELVDSAPKVIKEGLKKEEANEIKQKLEEAGATVELQ